MKSRRAGSPASCTSWRRCCAPAGLTGRAQLRRLPDRRHPPGAGERARRRGAPAPLVLSRTSRWQRPARAARPRAPPSAPAIGETGAAARRPRPGGGQRHRSVLRRLPRRPAAPCAPPWASTWWSTAAGCPPAGGPSSSARPRDRRVMFVLPDGLRTVVGTTDTDWSSRDRGRPSPRTTTSAPAAADVAYLLEAANHAFPGAALKPRRRAVHLRRPAAAAGQRRRQPLGHLARARHLAGRPRAC